MQKNVPKYTPDWVRTVHAVGGGVEARRVLRAVQRPPHAAVVRQPARGRVPPDAGPGRPTRPHHAPRARPRPARGRRVPDGGRGPPTWCARRWPTSGSTGAVKTSGAKGVHVFVPIDDDGVDRRTRPPRPGRSRRGPSGSIPSIATTAFMKEDRGGKVFVDSTRVGGATVVAAYSPRVRPGVPVSFPVGVGRPRRRRARPTSPCTPRSACSATRDPWADADARAAAAAAPTWSRRATPSRSPGCRPCTRASAAPGPAGATRPPSRAGPTPPPGAPERTERSGRLGRLGPCPSSSTTPSWRGATRDLGPLFAEMFGIDPPQHLGPFWQVETANGVALDFGSTGDREIAPQHYAFLVDERDFDAIHGRIVGVLRPRGPGRARRCGRGWRRSRCSSTRKA